MKINCANNKIEDVHKLIPNPKNPNHHPDKQIEMLAKIIDFQGQRSPIIVSKRSGFIVKGHGRLEAIKKLGWDKAAVDYQDYESEAQEHADMIADNQIAELSQTNQAELADLMSEIDLEDISLLGMLDTFDAESEFLDDDIDIDEMLEKQNTPPSNIETSHVKMVQLFLNDDTIQPFLERVNAIQSKLKTENLSDTVFDVIKRFYEDNCSK